MIDILDGDQAQAVENLRMENGRSSPSGNSLNIKNVNLLTKCSRLVLSIQMGRRQIPLSTSPPSALGRC